MWCDDEEDDYDDDPDEGYGFHTEEEYEEWEREWHPEWSCTMTREEIFRENTLRMRLFNRNWAMRLYHQPQPVLPPLPRLLHEDGIERIYTPRTLPLIREPLPADQNPEPVGAGPDEHMYYDVVEPDYHLPGWVFQTMKEGKTFVMVETVDEDGGFRRRWIQVA